MPRIGRDPSERAARLSRTHAYPHAPGTAAASPAEETVRE
jgi:hypothetical protein